MVGEMMMVTVGLNNQVRQLYTNYEDIYVPLCTGSIHMWWGLSAVPIWTDEQEVHVLELLGRNAWLNSSPEDEQSAYLLCGTFRCKQFSLDGTEFYTASTVSALRKNTKGKLCVQQIFVLYFPPPHLFCSSYLPAFHAISFTKPFPSLGLGNWLRWQSNLFSSRCHTKRAQWEDMEGNCIWPREWQISDRELNKSAQVLSKIPPLEFVRQEFQC